jgi:hypothetical protein
VILKEIIIKRDKQGNIIPVDNYERQLVIDTLKESREYKCKLTYSRNLKHLGKYWVLMKALEFHFGNTDEGWHLHYKAKFLPMVEFKVGNQCLLYPSSIAFENMDQLEFDVYYKKIENHLIESGYTIDDLINYS